MTLFLRFLWLGALLSVCLFGCLACSTPAPGDAVMLPSQSDQSQ